jgi:hypothetical protein
MIFDCPIDDYKQCKDCLELKSRDDFYKRSGRGARYGDGLMMSCKRCHNSKVAHRTRERRLAGDERLVAAQKEARKRWNKKHPEQLQQQYQVKLQKKKTRYHSDPEYRNKVKAQSREYKRQRPHSARGPGYACGEQHYRSKLTGQQVRDIRNLYAEGSIGSGKLAKRFGVSKSLVQNIVKRKIWKHVE